LYSIENEGLSCYVNGTLQLLLSCTGFCEKVLDTVESSTCDGLAHVIRAVQEKSQPKLNAAARSIRVRVGRLANQPEYVNKELQNDALELMGHLLSGIHNEIIDTDVESGYLRYQSIVETEFEMQIIQKKSCSQ
jgi:ubiquitin C-terminal hydrolase